MKIHIEYSILCDVCSYRDVTEFKKAKTIFRKRGWACVANYNYCPECAKACLPKHKPQTP